MSIDIMLIPGLSGQAQQTYPYEASLSSSASSSSSSVFSVDGALSQSSASVCSSIHRDSEYLQIAQKSSTCREQAPSCAGRQRPSLNDASLPQRPHPRRSSGVASHCPPPLVRQGERKIEFVDNLVESATQIVEVIWPLSVPSCREGPNGRGVLPLRTFIQETLRRSRTSYSTLQVALYYLILIKPRVPKHDFTMEQPEDMQSLRALQCGRRMFLAALILASKYLQDRNYSARAWSKISGLKVSEINTNEMAFLEAVNWRLHIIDPIFERWREIMLHYTPSKQPPPPPSPGTFGLTVDDWKSIIPLLTPELDTVPLPPSMPCTKVSMDASFPRGSPIPLPDVSQEMVSPPRPPRYLEPKPDVLPPTPSVPRMGPLPTPQMTPQSVASSTPAVGGSGPGSRRPSMCSAMATAQNACMTRMALDVFNSGPRFSGSEVYNVTGRRSSLAPSVSSLSSSPESMVSDHSSRLSRASSISSVSSLSWAPDAAKLGRLATCRNAKIPYSAQQFCPKEAAIGEQSILTTEPVSSPDFENFRLSDPEPPVQLPLPLRSKPIEPCKKASPSRKRARSSADFSLQQNVRDLLQASQSREQLAHREPSVVSDADAADSFLLGPSREYLSEGLCSMKALQSPTNVNIREGRLPVQKDLGRKRTCCASEAALSMRRPGPGMWERIL